LERADIYAVIAYYLANRESVEAYLQTQEAEADDLQRQIESDPTQQKATRQLREQFHARWAARHSSDVSSRDPKNL
jgi:hypothetical protein